MRTYKSLFLAILMITSVMAVFPTITASADEAAGGVDASNTEPGANLIPSENYWYEGKVNNATDPHDYYKMPINPGESVKIEVVAPQSDAIEFGYWVKATSNVWSYSTIEYGSTYTFTADNNDPANTRTLYLHFYENTESAINEDAEYCFKVYHVTNMTNSQNQHSCAPIQAPAINGVYTGGTDIFTPGTKVEINWTYEGSVETVDIFATFDSWDNHIVVVKDLNVSGGMGYYEMIVPVVNTDEFLIMVRDSNSDANDTSHQKSIAVGADKAITNCTQFDSLAGPTYIAGNTYMYKDIVEHPANSGEYWISKFDYNTQAPNPKTWFGPCDCLEIWNGTTWIANNPYHIWNVVYHQGTYWISMIHENPFEPQVGDFNGDGADEWKPCGNETGGSSGCDYEMATQYNGFGGPVWNNGDPTTSGSIYEYPSNSGQYWIATQDEPSPKAPDDPNGVDFWMGWCNCSDIWSVSGWGAWDSNTLYSAWVIVEHQANSGNLWIATGNAPAIGEEPGNSDIWKLCATIGNTGGGDDFDCTYEAAAQYNGHGGPVWVPNQAYAANEIVEWPSGSGEFWMSSNAVAAGSTSPDISSQWTGACNCSEIWSHTQTVWVAAGVYGLHEIVEFNGQLYLSNQFQNTGEIPEDNEKHWRICGGEETSPCEGSDGFVGPWYNQNQLYYFENDVVEYPAGSGEYYISTIDYNSAGPWEGELRGWVKCSCEDLWDGTTFATGTIYPSMKIVEHNGVLYIRSPAGHLMTGDPTPPHKWYWKKCEKTVCQPIGPWNQNQANSGLYDVGVTVKSSWFSSIKWRSTVDDNTNPLPSVSNPLAPTNGWERCKVKWDWEIKNPGFVSPPKDVAQIYNNSIHDKVMSGSTVYIYQDDSSLARYYLLVKKGGGYDCLGPCVANPDGGHSCEWGSNPLSSCGVGSMAVSEDAVLLDVQSHPGMDCDEMDAGMFTEGNVAVCVGGTVVVGAEPGTGGCWVENGGLMWMDDCTEMREEASASEDSWPHKADGPSVTDNLPIVTGACDYETLEAADVMIEGATDTTECGSMIIIPIDHQSEGMVTDIGGHLLIESTGIITDGENEFGWAYPFNNDDGEFLAFNAVGLTCEALEFPNGEWFPISEWQPTESRQVEQPDYFPITEWHCVDAVVETELPETEGIVDTTPRISMWPGMVNQHNENGTWMTDPDGVSGGHPSETHSNDYGGKELEYCQKFWPETVSVLLRDTKETITFSAAGNTGAYQGIKPVWECVMEEEVEDTQPSDADGDGVIDEWDDCPETASGTPTDSSGCVPEITDSEGNAIPAVGLAGVLTSLFVALFMTRRKFDEE